MPLAFESVWIGVATLGAIVDAGALAVPSGPGLGAGRLAHSRCHWHCNRTAWGWPRFGQLSQELPKAIHVGVGLVWRRHRGALSHTSRHRQPSLSAWLGVVRGTETVCRLLLSTPSPSASAWSRGSPGCVDGADVGERGQKRVAR